MCAMESVEVHCTGDAALQLSFSDGRTDSVSPDIVSRSDTLSNLLASAFGDQGEMMHVPRGYLQAWLEHVRGDMQAPPSETDVESLVLLLKAADFLADEISISSLCSELGQRVFLRSSSSMNDDSTVMYTPRTAMDTSLDSSVVGEGLESTPDHMSAPVSHELSSSSIFGLSAGLRAHHVVAVADSGAMAVDEPSAPLDESPVVYQGDQIISNLPAHLALSVIQAADAGLGLCLTRLAEAYHPLALCAHFPSITRDRALHICRDSFKTAPSSRVLRSVFQAAANFPGIRELRITPASSEAVSDEVVTSFENALSRMSLLTSLQVDDNFLTDSIASAVARNLPKLPHLSNLSLKAPIFWPRLRLARRQELQEALLHCPGLRTLSLSTIYGYCEENDEKDGTSALASALVQMTWLESLSLTAGSVNSGSLRALQALLPRPEAPWLPCMQHMRELNLSSNTSLRDDGAKILAPILSRLESLERLDISWNGICPEGAEALAPSFRGLTALRYINVSFNDLYDQGVGALAQEWTNLRNLKHLDMNMCSASATGCVKLSEAIAGFRHLSHLDLSRCLLAGGLLTGGVDDASGARALSDALRNHHSLRHLDLFGSGLNAEVMGHLSPCIAKHSELTCLDLRDRTMGAMGVLALSQRMTTLQNLKVFSLCCLNASAAAANGLSAALPALKSLQALDLTHFHSTPDGILTLVAALCTIKTLERMDLSFCELSSSAAMSMAPGLRTMTNLEVLHLNGNPIGDEGVLALAPAIAPLYNLTHLSLADTQMTLRGAGEIASSLDGREAIQRVVMMMNGFDRNSLPDHLRKPWVIC